MLSSRRSKSRAAEVRKVSNAATSLCMWVRAMDVSGAESGEHWQLAENAPKTKLRGPYKVALGQAYRV